MHNAPTELLTPQGSASPRRGMRLRGLDGLRAIAAIAVLLYHTWPTLAPGGFIGVDVFFVLSGFLITSLLIADIDTYGHIRIGRFWLRRWRRLFPAVATTAIVSVILALAISPDLLVQLPAQLAGTLTFSYNWVAIFLGDSYFEQMSPRLFTNMWTLAVEQQFYLVWPLVVLVLWKLPRRARPWLALALAAASVTVMARAVSAAYLAAGEGAVGGLGGGAVDLTRAYMGTDTHSFGLMAGATLALILGSPLRPSSRVYLGRSRDFAGLAGFAAVAALVVCFAKFNDAWPAIYPWGTLLAVLLSAAVIFAMTAPAQRGISLATLLSMVLDSKLLSWLGVRSYGIYLWHWPLLVIWWYLQPAASMPLTTAVVFTAATLCATLSYHFVENPMRRAGIISTLKRWFGMKTQKGLRIGAYLTSSIAAAALILMALALSMAPSHSQIETAVAGGGSVAQDESAIALGVLPGSGTVGREYALAQEAQAQLMEAAKQAAKEGGEPISTWGDYEVITAPEAEVRGENITILGDSVIKGISAAAIEKWPGVVVDGEVSRSYYAVTTLMEQYAAQDALAHYVVVGAANNGPLPQNVIEHWLDLIGSDRTLVLVTGHGNARTTWIADSNDAINAAVAAYPEQVVVADWFTLAEAHPEWLYRDLTHPSPAGVQPFIEMLDGSLAKASRLPNAIQVQKATN